MLWLIVLFIVVILINPNPPSGDEAYWYQLVFDNLTRFILGYGTIELPVNEHWGISRLEELRSVLLFSMLLVCTSFLISPLQLARIILRLDRCYLVYGDSPTAIRITEELMDKNLSVIRLMPLGQYFPRSDWPLKLEANESHMEIIFDRLIQCKAIIAADLADLNNVQFVQRLKQRSECLNEQLSVIARIDNELLADEVISLNILLFL